MVITPSVLLSLLLQVLQFGFVHHLLHQVLLPPHTVAEILRHVGNEVRYEGLDAIHQVLREALIPYELTSTDLHFICQYLPPRAIKRQSVHRDKELYVPCMYVLQVQVMHVFMQIIAKGSNVGGNLLSTF